MLQQQVIILNNVRMTIDALCIIFAGHIAYYLVPLYFDGAFQLDGLVFLGSVMSVMFLNNYIMGRVGLYGDNRPPSTLNMLGKILQANLVVFLLLTGVSYMFLQVELPRSFLMVFALGSFLLIAIGRLAEDFYIRRYIGNGFNTREILIVGNEHRGKLVTELMAKQLSWGHNVVGRLWVDREEKRNDNGVLGGLNDLSLILKENAIDEVIFAMNGDRSIDLHRYLEICRKMGIPIRILPALWQPGNKYLSAERCQGVPFLTVQAANINATGILYKRMLDIIGSFIGCLLLLVMLPVVGILIKIDSSGPIFFSQSRIGRNGRIFPLYKFRTMVTNAEDMKKDLLVNNVMSGGMFKMKNDPRVTRVGAWLRNTSLDEFPQFINVLRGEMSLVGTRPPTLDEVKGYEEWQRRRISAKPGITGLWQVSGRSKVTDFNEVVELDCKYLDDWRFRDDLRIILQTILVILQRKGAM